MVWGDGDELQHLQERKEKEIIDNVVFKGKVEKKYVPYITSHADLNYAHNDNSPLFRFGVSFNKIFDYMAAGKPILCDFEAKYNPILMNNCGVCIFDSSQAKIARSIEKMMLMNVDKYKEYCYMARKSAQKYDFRNLTKELVAILEQN